MFFLLVFCLFRTFLQKKQIKIEIWVVTQYNFLFQFAIWLSIIFPWAKFRAWAILIRKCPKIIKKIKMKSTLSMMLRWWWNISFNIYFTVNQRQLWRYGNIADLYNLITFLNGKKRWYGVSRSVTIITRYIVYHGFLLHCSYIFIYETFWSWLFSYYLMVFVHFWKIVYSSI